MNLVARKGIGKTHAKWSPVSTCTMRKEPIVEIDQDKINRELDIPFRKQFVQSCPRNVFKFNELRSAVEIEDSDKCILCQECFRFAQTQGLERAIRIGERDDKFIFSVESTGVMSPEDIVMKALAILIAKIKTLNESLNKYRSND